MREFRDTRIEISAEGDIELLDFALSSWGLGEVERNRRWLKTNPWFEAERVPEIRRRVRALV